MPKCVPGAVSLTHLVLYSGSTGLNSLGEQRMTSPRNNPGPDFCAGDVRATFLKKVRFDIVSEIAYLFSGKSLTI